MSISQVSVNGLAMQVFIARLRECPAAYAEALRVSADMIESGELKDVPFKGSDHVTVASYDGSIVGFVVLSENTAVMQLELAWVDPGLRRSGIFTHMFEKLRYRWWAGLDTTDLVIRETRLPTGYGDVLRRMGFDAIDEQFRYVPFYAKANANAA